MGAVQPSEGDAPAELEPRYAVTLLPRSKHRQPGRCAANGGPHPAANGAAASGVHEGLGSGADGRAASAGHGAAALAGDGAAANGVRAAPECTADGHASSAAYGGSLPAANGAAANGGAHGKVRPRADTFAYSAAHGGAGPAADGASADGGLGGSRAARAPRPGGGPEAARRAAEAGAGLGLGLGSSQEAAAELREATEAARVFAAVEAAATGVARRPGDKVPGGGAASQSLALLCARALRSLSCCLGRGVPPGRQTAMRSATHDSPFDICQK